MSQSKKLLEKHLHKLLWMLKKMLLWIIVQEIKFYVAHVYFFIFNIYIVNPIYERIAERFINNEKIVFGSYDVDEN